jgi:hypothetical protein
MTPNIVGPNDRESPTGRAPATATTTPSIDKDLP